MACPTRRRTPLALCLPILLAGCGPTEETEPLTLERVSPGVASGQVKGAPARLFLNSAITLHFSQDLDPLAVTTDTVQLVALEGAAQSHGARVEFAQVRVGVRSVTLVPRPPVQSDLQDGSLRPATTYKLIVPGFPRTNTVASRRGSSLPRTFTTLFRTVDAETGDPELPTPFLPVGTGTESFELRGRHDRLAQMAAGSGCLELHFSLPLLPSSVRTTAFRLIRLRGRELLDVPLAAARIKSYPAPIDPHPGCAVELLFEDRRDVRANDWLFLDLSHPEGLRDYRGRPLLERDRRSRIPVRVHKSRGLTLLRLPRVGMGQHPQAHLTTKAYLTAAAPHRVGFTVDAGGFVGSCLVEAGTGAHGRFAPRQATMIRPGQTFDRGDGVMILANDQIDFASIDIPADVEVRVQGPRPITLRSLGSVRIAGDLIVDVVPPRGQMPELVSARARTLEEIRLWSPLVVVAGAHIDVSGRVIQAHDIRERQPSLALIGGGPIRLSGVPSSLPIGALLHSACDQIEGPVASQNWLPVHTESGTAVGDGSLVAEAWTSWARLPADHGSNVLVRAVQANGCRAAVQFAPGHPLDPNRPYLDAVGRWQQIPERGLDLTIPPGSHVRFCLSGLVAAGQPPPSIRELIVETR